MADMGEFRAIEIDFDVHKLIEGERKSFSESPNDVLRRLLGLAAGAGLAGNSPSKGNKRSWVGEGVTLPHGTLVRMHYNGRQHSGQIADGKWVVDGHIFDSPSGAASGVAITRKGQKTRLDGWRHWEVHLPTAVDWAPLGELRPKPISLDKLTLAELGL